MMQLWNSSEFQILCSLSIRLLVSGLKLDSNDIQQNLIIQFWIQYLVKKTDNFKVRKKRGHWFFFFFSRCPGEKRKSCIKWKKNTQDPIKILYFLHVLPFSPYDSQFKPMSVLISGRFVNLFGDFSPLCAVGPQPQLYIFTDS